MKLVRLIILTLIAGATLYSCGSQDEAKFVGVWSNVCEEEVDAVGFYEMFDTLTLNDDNSFSQKLTYVNSSNTDTVAKVEVTGKWALNDSCFEMSYATDTIFVHCEDPELYVAFYNDMAAKINRANAELCSAHEQNTTYGVKQAMADDKAIISRNANSEEIYFRVK